MDEQNEENKPAASTLDTVKKYLKRFVEYMKVAKMEYIVMIALFALDLISKAIVNATTEVYQTVVLIPNFLNITNVHNYAAAFGSDVIKNALGDMGARILFCIFAVVASVVFIIILVRNKGGHKLFRVALAMVTAGAMGNCIDRMALGYVRDFIEFVYFGLEIWGQKSFWVFNIADSCLVIGVILIVVYFIFIYKDKDSKKHESLMPAPNADGVAPVTEPTESGATVSADAEAETSDTASEQITEAQENPAAIPDAEEETQGETDPAQDQDAAGESPQEPAEEQTTEHKKEQSEEPPAKAEPQKRKPAPKSTAQQSVAQQSGTQKSAAKKSGTKKSAAPKSAAQKSTTKTSAPRSTHDGEKK